jgi:hypothetical protein
MAGDEVVGAAVDDVVGATTEDVVEYGTGALDVPTSAEELDGTAVLVGATCVDDGGAAELLGGVYGVGVGGA